MSENKPNTERDWAKFDAHVLTAADYEEIPEITDADWDRAVLSHGVAEPDLAVATSQADLRLDPDVAKGLRNSGEGWEARANETLRDWLKSRAA